MNYRWGVDVGGTFTDLLLIDEDSGLAYTAKVPSTPQDSSIGVLNGIARICEQSGVNPEAISRVMHGTTVATNTILTSTGARVGLVATAGYRQVLQIARSFVPGGLGGWVIFKKSPLLAPLELTVEAEERIGADGKVLKPLNEAALRESLGRLAGKGIEALTICFINAYVDGAHERRAREIAQEVLPGIPVSISSEVVPEMQEYERTETTVVNSYVRPVVGRYMVSLQEQLQQRMKSVHLSVLRSDGGLASARSAAETPVNLLLSGPAGGVTGALWFASRAGYRNILTFDMGGTSTDVALIQDAKAQVRRETRVADVMVRAPSIDVRTVGAGGGSIAFVPELTRALRVGPDSAGAEPGPAAYKKGGTQPTVCDANVVLGYLPADAQLGGDMAIDKSLADKAVQQVADEMDINLMEAAEGIIKIVNETMFGALRLVSVEQGFDPRDFALVGFGGAGPLHANAIGKLLNSWPVIIPPGPGVLCAHGDATTLVQDEAARTYVRKFTEIDSEELLHLLDELRTQASSTLVEDDIPEAEQDAVYQADVRYHGQAFQITIDFTTEDLRKKGLALLSEEFDRQHTQLFTFALDVDHELVMVRTVVRGRPAALAERNLAAAERKLEECKVQDTRYYSEGQWHDAAIYNRELLHTGHRVPGPAIIIEMDSTTVILPDYEAEVDAIGNLLLNPA